MEKKTWWYLVIYNVCLMMLVGLCVFILKSIWPMLGLIFLLKQKISNGK